MRKVGVYKTRRCPFCGNNKVSSPLKIEQVVLFHVVCAECGAHGGGGDTVREAVEIWNGEIIKEKKNNKK